MEWLNEPCEFIHDEATYRCMRVKDTPFQHQIVCCGSMQKSKFEHCNRLNLPADSICCKGMSRKGQESILSGDTYPPDTWDQTRRINSTESKYNQEVLPLSILFMVFLNYLL